jgi:hypothetical protein
MRLAAAALGLALLGAGACQRGADTEDARAPARPDAAPGAPAATASRVDPASVPPGGVALRWADGRVDLVSRGARLDRVLDELGRAAGFVVEGSSPRTDRSVEMRIDDAPLADALSRLLEGADWAAEYVTREEGHRLARVRLGPAPESSAEAPARAASERVPAADAVRSEAQEDEEPLPGASRAAVEDADREEAELAAALVSSDAVRRAEAVQALDYAYAEDFERLLRFAHDDPDPAVRAAALEALDGDTSYGALKALVGALGDRDPAVVVRAIEALAGYEDETVAPELEPLREHRDPAVRRAAEEALGELLE